MPGTMDTEMDEDETLTLEKQQRCAQEGSIASCHRDQGSCHGVSCDGCMRYN